MPEASDALRALMAKWFPRCTNGYSNEAGVDDSLPMEFLHARGWTEHGGIWSKPTPSYTPSIYEIACLVFLRDEWDYDWKLPLFSRYSDLLEEPN